MPQYLLNSLVKYVKNNPKAFFEAEVIHVWSLGIAPYADEKLEDNFRLDSSSSGTAQETPSTGWAADYIRYSSVRFQTYSEGNHPIDVALIQTSPSDQHVYMNLGVSIDIVKAAVEMEPLVIAQLNSEMPKIHGDGFLNVEDVDYLVPFD